MSFVSPAQGRTSECLSWVTAPWRHFCRWFWKTGLVFGAIGWGMSGAQAATTVATMGGTVAVSVVDGAGKPVADAVVTILPDAPSSGASASGPIATAPLVMDQVDETYVPYVLIVPKGRSVLFRNSDTTRHHIYSASPIARFEFVLAAGQSEVRKFDEVGLVTLGCNIHDQMVAYLVITGAPFHALTGKDGTVSFNDVPAGSATLDVWHPRLKPGVAAPHQKITVGEGGTTSAIAVPLGALNPDARREHDPDLGHY